MKLTRLAAVALAGLVLAGCADTPDEVVPADDGVTVTAIRVEPIQYGRDQAGEFQQRPCNVPIEPCNGLVVGAEGTGLGLTIDPILATGANPESLFWLIDVKIDWSNGNPDVDALRVNVTSIPKDDPACAARLVLDENKTESPIVYDRLEFFPGPCDQGLTLTVLPDDRDLLVPPLTIKYDAKVSLRGFVPAADPVVIG